MWRSIVSNSFSRLKQQSLKTGSYTCTSIRCLSSANFTQLGLDVAYTNALKEKFDIHIPTEIQEKAIPNILQGNDTVICSETGSGKTFAYVLPLLHRLNVLQQLDQTNPLITVLVPSRELAIQAANVTQQLFPELKSTCFACYGNIGPGKHHATIVLFTTPKGLKENIHPKRLRNVQALVLDEADLLLSGEFAEDTRSIIRDLTTMRLQNTRPQVIFCGATLPDNGRRSVKAYINKYFTQATESISSKHHQNSQSLTSVCYALPGAELLHNMDMIKSLGAPTENSMQDTHHTHSLHVAASISSLLHTPDTPIELKYDLSESNLREIDPTATDPDIVAAYHAKKEAEYQEIQTDLDNRLQALMYALLSPMASDVSVVEKYLQDEKRFVSMQHCDSSLFSEAWQFGPKEEIRHEGKSTNHDKSDSTQLPKKLSRHMRRRQQAEARYSSKPTMQTSKHSFNLNPIQTMVFCNSTSQAKLVYQHLSRNIPDLTMAVLHKGLSDENRSRHLATFAEGKTHVLICTDIASRGIDTIGVEHVIHFDFANDVINFLHRNGRTGRAGRSGRVTYLIGKQDVPLAAAIQINQKLGKSLDELFSRNRGLRRRVRRLRQANQPSDSLASDENIQP